MGAIATRRCVGQNAASTGSGSTRRGGERKVGEFTSGNFSTSSHASVVEAAGAAGNVVLGPKDVARRLVAPGGRPRRFDEALRGALVVEGVNLVRCPPGGAAEGARPADVVDAGGNCQRGSRVE